MKMVGKVFAILVLVLSLAVAVLSYMLAEQRKVFRAHSEALAQGLLRVANEVKGMDGVDVSAEMGKVSYSKAPAGGKESGTLGFEDFRKNGSAVSSSVDALISGLKKRQEQMEAFAVALENTGAAAGLDKAAGANKEELLTSEDYSKKLDVLVARAKQVQARDEAIRKSLADIADALGADSVEVSAARFAECAKDDSQKNGFSIGKVFTEIDNAVELTKGQMSLYAGSMQSFKSSVNAYDSWNFDARNLSTLESDYLNTSKAGNADGEASRKKYLASVKSKLSVFASDGEGLNKFIGDKVKENKQLKEQTEELRYTAEKVQEQKDELTKKIAEVQALNDALKKQNEWAEKNLNELKMAKNLNEIADDPLQSKIIKELSEVDTSVSCDISQVEAKYNFVIISAGNRKVCPGTRMIVLNGNGSATRLKAVLEVKECNDYMSKAFVVRGKIGELKVGDRVEMSVEHETMVKELAEDKEEAEEAKVRAEREAEDAAARAKIEERKKARQAAAAAKAAEDDF